MLIKACNPANLLPSFHAVGCCSGKASGACVAEGGVGNHSAAQRSQGGRASQHPSLGFHTQQFIIQIFTTVMVFQSDHDSFGISPYKANDFARSSRSTEWRQAWAERSS